MKKAEVKFIFKDERTGQKISMKFDSVETIDNMIASLQATRYNLAKKILVNEILNEDIDVLDKEDELREILGDKEFEKKAFAQITKEYNEIKREYNLLDKESKDFMRPLMQFIDNAYKRYIE